MRHFNFVGLTAGLFLMVFSAFAADVDGKWTGTFSIAGGDYPVAFTFKADGAMLSGSTTGPDGGEVKIANGMVDGNKISFSVSFDAGGMPITLDYKGVLTGQEIKFTVDVMGMPADLTVKKMA